MRVPARSISSKRLLAGVALLAAGAAWADPGVIDAVKAGDRARVAALLQQGVDPSVAEVDGTTALHWAAELDDAATAELLLGAGAPVTASNRYGVTPLLLAASHGNEALLATLIAAGADPGHALDDGLTPLMVAARNGNPAALRVLLDGGADPNWHEHRQGETALIWAAAENRAEAVAVLTEYGADVDARSNATTFPRHSFGDGIVAVRMTLPHGAWTPLMYAAREGALDAALALLAAGADTDLTDPQGTTALTHAINNAHYDVATALLAHGADVNIADVTGMTALYAAVDMSTITNTPGRPAPKPTGADGAVGEIRRLLNRGADPNARLLAPILQRQHSPGDPALGEAATPLLRAAKTPVPATIRLLLDHGADATQTTATGTTAIMLAAGPSGGRLLGDFPVGDNDKIEAIDLFLDRGVDIDAVDANGQTALHLAAAEGNAAVVSALLQRGARADLLDARGHTALDVARGVGARPGAVLQAEAVAVLESQVGAVAGSAVR